MPVDILDPAIGLPLAFAFLMGVSILIYVVLDGYDLGIGALFLVAPEADKDRMVASIGPFWDANETWLVLAVGLLLVAFPMAHGMILTALYLPVAVLLIGLILRGVAFEFRAKVDPVHKRLWNRLFAAGSLLATLAQGFMLGLYLTGLEYTPATIAFAILSALGLTGAYAFIGATWLIHKTDGDLQSRAVAWARRLIPVTALGLVAISIASPLVSTRIAEKWFSVPEMVLLAPLPIMSVAILIALWFGLRHLPTPRDRLSWAPFLGAAGLFGLAFMGLAYSFYPYVVPEKLTLYEAASAPESLAIILVGALVVVPIIGAYTVYAYRVFGGKATELRYD